MSVLGAFDGVAPLFEESFENSSTRTLRKKLYEEIRTLAPIGASVLDINCGIGIDAVELALQGYRVLGVDISPKMIEQAELRARNHNAGDVRFLVASFENMSALGEQQFDLILSNFGGLNCVPSLAPVAKQLAALAKPRSHLVAVVMPPMSAWEILAGLGRFNPGLAFRRLKRRVYATGFGENTFLVHYYSPRAVRSAFRSWFAVTGLCGLSIFSPPPGAIQFRQAHPRLSGLLDQFDEIISQVPLVRAIGDHYMITLRRASDVGE